MTKQVYIPTEEELKEVGFTKVGGLFNINPSHQRRIISSDDGFFAWTEDEFGEAWFQVYPASRQDVETLIRLLTP